MRDIIETVSQWIEEDRQIALATVTETWGSAPRGVGAKMALTDEMAMTGSVSGGCVETAVIREGIESLKDGKPRLLNYGVSDDTAWEVGLTCGGKISVYVEPLDRQWWRLVTKQIKSDMPAVTLTIVEGDHAGTKALYEYQTLLYASAELPRDADTAFFETGTKAVKSGRAQVAGYEVMIDAERPRPHLILVGGAHVAMPLADFAHRLGFRVSLVDPRRVFATPERFPVVAAISHRYPDRALPELGLDADTYVAVLTHDPKIDDKAILAALPSPARYVGVLSSKKTHVSRLERLREAGLSDDLLARIHTPIGLDIGASTPEEIALCIMAEIIKVRNATV